jgi:hypothetical protein
VHLWRRRPPIRLRSHALLGRLDWSLIALLVASLCVVARYQTAFEPTQDGARQFVTDGDQTYYASLVYELGRHVPPLQQPIRAGNPERAYHLFPHLTTMLVGRFTGQHDVLRTHLVYEYAWRVFLLCLATFCMARVIAGSRPAGYLAVAVLYVLAIPMEPWVRNSIGFFFFTGHPQATSSVEPVLLTSPQMFSGLVVTYGVLVGVLWMSLRSRSRLPIAATAMVSAILVGSLMRFRIQAFLPVATGFVLILAIAWARSRERALAAAAAAVLLLSVLLYLEMGTPVYLAGSTEVVLGNNLLTFRKGFEWLNAWPFSRRAREALQGAALGPWVRQWIWQGVSLSMFTLANVVGIPALACAFMFLVRPAAWREWRLLSSFAVWLVAASVFGAMTLAASYDPFSLGGQMPLHAGYYLLPLAVVGGWNGAGHFLRSHRSRLAGGIVLAAAVSVGFLWQMVRPPSFLEARGRRDGFTLSPDEFALLTHMRESLPADAVIISTRHIRERYAAFSGLSGRRAYLEYGATPMDYFPEVARDVRRRLETIWKVWTASSEPALCSLLSDTPATHIVEYRDDAMRTRGASCLELLSVSPEVTLWRVRR